MNDPLIAIARLVVLALVPAMLLAPALLALLARTRVEGEAERLLVRARSIALVAATLVALAIWLGALIVGMTGPRIAPLATVAKLSWILFFPLWFGFAMPLIAAKNPAMAGAKPLHGGPVRTASLVARHRESPLRKHHWIAGALPTVTLLLAISSRGLAGPFDDAAARARWIFVLALFAATAALTFLLVPLAVRQMLREPEPLDAQGSPELEAMYRGYRDTRIRGLFWLLYLALPATLGLLMAIMTWTGPRHGASLGLMGGLAGTVLGIAGAWFGIAMAIRKWRIQELRARHDGPASSTTAERADA